MSIHALLVLPGIVIHELGHYLLCRLVGAPVKEVVFFDQAGPSGYVVHTIPRRLRHHLVIVAGPLLLNSALSFLLFRAAASSLGLPGGILLDRSVGFIPRIVQIFLAVLLGTSIALQAIPSLTDASSLWTVALERLERGNLLALGVLPFAGGLILVNYLRRFWIDWLYLALLAALAVWFPGGQPGHTG